MTFGHPADGLGTYTFAVSARARPSLVRAVDLLLRSPVGSKTLLLTGFPGFLASALLLRPAPEGPGD